MHISPHHQRLLMRGCIVLLAIPLLCCGLFGAAYILFPPDPVDIVLLGVDARPGQGYLTRTDSVIIANITPRTARITLLSIPRDVFIDVPYYGEQRINTINVLGEQDDSTTGPALVKASLEQSFGIEIEHYARIDFGGFVALVDAVGGIDVNVPKPVIDYEYPTAEGGTMTIQFEAGWQHMDGERALQYARTRHQDDDFQRAARQQRVIDALIKRIMSPGQIANWPKLWQAFDSHVDSDMSLWDAVRLTPAVLVGWPTHTQRVLQREDLIVIRQGYRVPDYEKLTSWIADRFD